MLRRLRGPNLGRVMLWASSLVLIAGVIAFATVRLGSSDAAPPGEPVAAETDVDPVGTTPAISEVPRAARVAAGQFILAAVGREDLPKAWELSHPDLRSQCGCSYKQWLTGNIPVQPFPTSGLEGVTYAVDELTRDRVVLLVLLTAKPGSELSEGIFYIGLKPSGSGKNRTWLVDYWAPKSTIPVPQTG